MCDALNNTSSDALLVVVTFARPADLRPYREHLNVDAIVVTDQERVSHQTYGLGRGSLRQIYRWATIRRYVELLRAGRRMHRPVDDTRQLGGDFVVGAEGRVLFAFRPVAPDDRPEPAAMINALGRATDN